MSVVSDQEDADATARRLMREGFDDEAIAERTGLPLQRLLALRAGAATADRASRRPRGD